MKKIPCPLCPNRRLFDSNKRFRIVKADGNNEDSDFQIKCLNCKNTLSVTIERKTAS